jgi:hypothetical protein
MSGGCYQFHLILKELFPQSEPYMSDLRDHIVTKINGAFYDIRGVVDTRFSGLYNALSPEDLVIVSAWSFSKNHQLVFDSCPVCEEPITIPLK